MSLHWEQPLSGPTFAIGRQDDDGVFWIDVLYASPISKHFRSTSPDPQLVKRARWDGQVTIATSVKPPSASRHRPVHREGSDPPFVWLRPHVYLRSPTSLESPLLRGTHRL
jgi:hypothetical protein